MSGATWEIDQAAPPNGAGAGTPGVSRKDLWLNRVCTLSAVSPLGTSSFLWELLYAPPGSVAVLSTPDQASTDITLDIPTKSYRVRLTTDGGGSGNVMTLILSCTKGFSGATVNRGWRTPAVNEQLGEPNFDGNVNGYAPDYDFIVDDILANADFGGGGSSGFVPVDASSSPYLVEMGDIHIAVDTISIPAPVTVILPPPGPGLALMRYLEIKDAFGGALANNITIDGNGTNIDGDPTRTIAVNYGSILLRYNGTQWGIL